MPSVRSPDLDAETAADDPALLLELDDDLLGDVGGDGEADADVAAAAGEARGHDAGVDADDLAPHVDERAAAVAAVDGRVGLDEVLVALGVDRARPL